MLGSIWPFLKEQGVILGSIAAIVAIAGGIWKFVDFFAKKSEKSGSTTTVKADHCGVAAGRDITGPVNSNTRGDSARADHGSVAVVGVISAPVTIGLDQKGVGQELEDKLKLRDEKLDKILAHVARHKSVEIAPLRSILVKLGAAGVKDENIPKRLDEKADELVKLRAKVDALQQGSPGLAAIAQEAQALIVIGDLDGASRALAARREASLTRRIDAIREDAEILALEARVDDLQLAYRTAAAKYGEAAGLVAPFDTERQWRFLHDQASELSKQGDEFGDNAALAEAIDVYGRCLALVPRSERPLDWAVIQNNLGNVLAKLGARESGTARLDEAVSAFHEALQESTRDRVPRGWAKTQVNLGTTLRLLGERERGTAPLTEAVEAYREALQELTRARVPLEWAGTQMNLGAALRLLGERESNTARLEEGCRRLSRRLGGKYPCAPLDWAKAQMNLGNALQTLGKRESGTGRLEEAVAAYREALQENTRARVPLDWAMTQYNLGNTFAKLGERKRGTARLEEAVTAYRAALKEWTRDGVPLQWASTQMNLGLALGVLGERKRGTARLEEAVAACREALQEYTRERAPLDWANTQMNLGIALQVLGERERGTARLEEAVAAFREALQELTRARVPLRGATTQMNLAEIHRSLFIKTGNRVYIDDAFEAVDGALGEIHKAETAHYIVQAERLHRFRARRP